MHKTHRQYTDIDEDIENTGIEIHNIRFWKQTQTKGMYMIDINNRIKRQIYYTHNEHRHTMHKDKDNTHNAQAQTYTYAQAININTENTQYTQTIQTQTNTQKIQIEINT